MTEDAFEDALNKLNDIYEKRKINSDAELKEIEKLANIIELFKNLEKKHGMEKLEKLGIIKKVKDNTIYYNNWLEWLHGYLTGLNDME